MSNAARDWLDKGEIWRHPDTGHVAGPVVREYHKANNPNGRVNRYEWAVSGLLLAAYVVFVLSAGYSSSHSGPHSSASSAMPMMLVVGAIVGLAAVAVRAGLALDSYIKRGLVGVALVVTLWCFHFPAWAVLLGLVLGGVAILARYMETEEINARWKARGYRETIARPKTSGGVDRMPENYSGTWRIGSQASEWESGRCIGIYRWHLVPNLGANNLEPGNDTHRMSFLHRFATEKYPYGWVFDPSIPGYVPRQSDPYASPVADDFGPAEPSEAHGKPQVIPEDDLRRMGAAHAAGHEW